MKTLEFAIEINWPLAASQAKWTLLSYYCHTNSTLSKGPCLYYVSKGKIVIFAGVQYIHVTYTIYANWWMSQKSSWRNELVFRFKHGVGKSKNPLLKSKILFKSNVLKSENYL